jgi:diaminopimelate decarboxylase
MEPPFTYQQGGLFCEGVALREAAGEYGTPLYIYSRHAILESCREVEAAFGETPHLTCYAVKANANRHLLQLIAAEGLGADVGSKGELFLALEAGFSPKKVTYSGVGKRDDEIAFALEQDVQAFAVESVQEIEVLDQIAARLGRRGRILLRVNLDIDAGGHAYVSTSKHVNKFGIPHTKAREILRWARGLPHIEVAGIHSHIGSQITDPDIFLRAARTLARLLEELRGAGLVLSNLDFGGGFGIQYHGFLSDPGLPPDAPRQRQLSPAEMIRAILPVLSATGCALSIQPGRALVAQAGILLVKVLYRKESDHKTFIIVDGGMNDLIRPSLYQAYHQIVPVSLRNLPHELVDIVGPVCESGDFFAQDRMLSRSDRGDLLAILGAGAYGYVLASNYNARLRPAEVLVDGVSHHLIRERERLDDL